MLVNLLPCRIHGLLRPSLRLPLLRCSTLPLASPSQASPPNPSFAVEYLVQSCGLSSEDALAASKNVPRLNSPDKPDAVLRFLRELGVAESDIRTAVFQNARILCINVEKSWKPNIAKLQEVGFSLQVISGIIAQSPDLFLVNFVPKVDFWLTSLGSIENLYVVLTRHRGVLSHSSLDNVLIPNLSFLKHQCGFSSDRIVRLIKSAYRCISSKPELLQNLAERADRLGVARSSGAFLDALILVSYLNDSIIDARLNNLKNLGFSQEEIANLVSKKPLVLAHAEELVVRKVDFLRRDACCDMSDVAQNPSLLTYSVEKRLMPRNLVRKLLVSKRLVPENMKLISFMTQTEEVFLKKFVLPFEHAIPNLYQAYVDAKKN